MKNIKTVLVLSFLWGVSSFVSSKSTPQTSTNDLNSRVRKPFVSPEQPALMQNFKRIKRQNMKAVHDFQDFLLRTKEGCALDMGFNLNEVQKSLLYEDNPTPKEKCLLQCILKRTEIMNNTNKVATRTIARIADMISNNNPLVVHIAVAAADNCNRHITAQNPCEAAFQISRCIAHELKMHKAKLFY